MNLKEFFDKLLDSMYNKHYKKLVLIPLLFIIADFAIIGNTYVQTGDFMQKDVSLAGGTIATIYSDTNLDNLESTLREEFPNSQISITDLTEFGTDKKTGAIVEATNIKSDEIKSAIEKKYDLKLTQDNFSIEEVGSSLGESFYKQMMIAMAFAFLFMSITVLIIFRHLVPSLAVIVTAFTDILTTIAILDLIGMKISTAGIAALLMLIGYSIDTDMLLTTRVLKRTEGTVASRIKGSIMTGLTMTVTTMTAMLVAIPISQSPVLKQMFTIILIGLAVDVVATYFFSAGMLAWYMKRRQAQ